jgi:hemerythrin-like domain-containing protein
MKFSNRVSQKLHDEHMATVALMERLDKLVATSTPPDTADRLVARVLTDLATDFEAEVWRHFDFEEEHLLTYLAESGDAALGEHLREEHKVIRPVGARVIELARTASREGFDDARWGEFRKLSTELTGLLLAHVDKEEAALVPAVEEAMDAETEERLYEEYVMNN